MTDQGRSALAARLHNSTLHHERGGVDDSLAKTACGQMGRPTRCERKAAAILGTTGLFIADVTKHEPEGALTAALQPFVTCSCGWNTYGKLPDRLFFDHIGAIPDSTGAREP